MDQWASAVCGQILGWNEDVTAIIRQYDRVIERDPGDQALREATQEFLDGILSSLGELGEAVEGRGQPDVPAGDAVAREIREAIEEPRRALGSFRAEAGEDGIRPTTEMFQTVARTIADVVVSVWDVFDRAGRGGAGGEPLAAASSASAECRDLRDLATTD